MTTEEPSRSSFTPTLGQNRVPLGPNQAVTASDAHCKPSPMCCHGPTGGENTKPEPDSATTENTINNNDPDLGGGVIDQLC